MRADNVLLIAELLVLGYGIGWLLIAICARAAATREAD